MVITVLDSETLGDDISLEKFKEFGEVKVYKNTGLDELCERISDCDIIVVNKIKLGEAVLEHARRLRLICVTATGYDNIDIEYCRKKGIAVCNVKGYSTSSVAQITLAMAFSLCSNLDEFCEFVRSGEYSESGTANRLTPVYREMSGKTWGILGAGNIGKQVAACAAAMGCRVIACKRTPDEVLECVDIDTLCKQSDIISVHIPLSEETRGLVNKRRIEMMKKDAVFINVARGAVTDEQALADAMKNGKLGGLGIDVYSTEPFDKEHPFYEIKDMRNVCFTPHMAWGAYEARVRCIDEVVLNIRGFLSGEGRNRVN